MIKGLIFDCDGTLADTMPLHWRAWSAVTERHGLHFPQDRFYALGGVPARTKSSITRRFEIKETSPNTCKPGSGLDRDRSRTRIPIAIGPPV